MPQGLMPGMDYEEGEVILSYGDSILFYSDGLVEAHNPQREMFGFPLLKKFVDDHPGGANLIDFLLDRLSEFTGANWEQEDDVTLVTLKRNASEGADMKSNHPSKSTRSSQDNDWQTLADFTLPSELGNERIAMERIAEAVRELQLAAPRVEMLKTAVAETTMNAIEHCNKCDPEIPVAVQLVASSDSIQVRISGKGGDHPKRTPETPDLEAKLEGKQTPRGWGLFLIDQMVDEMRETNDGENHTFELIMKLGEDHDVEAN